jgi:uncharacterized protein (TIGR03435 family)
VLLICGMCRAQSPAKITFEVATVKPFNPETYDPAQGVLSGGPGTADPELFRSSLSLRDVMMVAYKMHSDQIIGPGWMQDARFEIRARVPRGASLEQVRVMLQNLVVERFHATLHHEMKDFAAYEMTVAKGGPKLQQTKYPNAKPAVNDPKFTLDKNDFPVLPEDAAVQARVNWIKKDAIHSTFRAFTTSRLAEEVGGALPDLLPVEMRLPVALPARVIDKTGLKGEYDFTLEYQSASTDATGPNIFNALEKQLGLHLEKIKLPLDVIVIDHIEKTPEEN